MTLSTFAAFGLHYKSVKILTEKTITDLSLYGYAYLFYFFYMAISALVFSILLSRKTGNKPKKEPFADINEKESIFEEQKI